ncbi:hypothetical protein M407DRAFT_214036 [Tulasnella calospora MUT 4182]|uniref:Restriction of telomere capping protein 4 n=1 Tax=Tulasnella calospora MUT 4182 TaxID=1051891 RepID=A0A0C3LR56_9AGAM|nr:hypothetical protein M407DRAFT_214036 [Tulasnella calospora MUT 4182]
MSSQAKNKSQIVAAFATLGLTRSQVLAIFADDETSASSTALPQSATTSQHRQPHGDLDSPSSTMIPTPALPSVLQEAASATVQQFEGLAATRHTVSAAVASHPASTSAQGHTVAPVAPSTRPGLMEPSAGPQGPSAGVGSGFGRSLEYFGMQAAPASGNGLDALRSLAAQPVIPTSNALPASGMPQYFSLPPESRGQWGSSGTVSSQLPSHVPSSLAPMLAPAYGPMRATPAAPSSAPRFSANPTRARPAAPTRNRPITNIDKVVIVPSPLYERYTSYLSYACQRAGLSCPISLETGFSKEAVFKVLVALFGDKLDFDIFHFEWMFLSQQTGDSLIEANIPPRPCGTQISKAYRKKSVIFLRLQISAVPLLPRFKEFIRKRCAELGKSAAQLLNDPNLLEDGELMEEEADLVEDEGEFQCDRCGGVFLSLSRAPHLLKCIGSRKRTASTRHTSKTLGPVDPSSSPERVRRPTKKAKPLVRAPASPTRATSSSSRNTKLRLRSVTPAASALGEEVDQLEEDERTARKDSGAGDWDEEDGDEEDMDGDEEEEGDDDYEDDVGFEDEDNGFGEQLGGDHRSGSGVSVRTPSLCPFCDEILPKSLSPALKDALTSALRSAVRKPLPSNPNHYQLEWTRSIAVCSIHHAQTTSEASGLSWPTSIDFGQVPVRLLAHRQDLLAVLEGASTAHAVLEGFRDGSHPLTSTGAKLGALKYLHAGYYGPQGYELLCNSLLQMFSLQSANCLSVLSFFDFVHYVLAPYASFLLIRDDLKQDLQGSEIWMRWEYSRAHGEAYFPEM